ncbi:MAG: hypothetical protein ACETVY_00670 [Candidatus Bathyarchaeia archaeon]
MVTRLLYRPWTWLYVTAGLSFAACVAVVYFVTTSGDPSIEWVFWVFFGLTLALIAGGYYVERDYRRRQGNSRLSEFEDILGG